MVHTLAPERGAYTWMLARWMTAMLPPPPYALRTSSERRA